MCAWEASWSPLAGLHEVGGGCAEGIQKVPHSGAVFLGLTASTRVLECGACRLERKAGLKEGRGRKDRVQASVIPVRPAWRRGARSQHLSACQGGAGKLSSS